MHNTTKRCTRSLHRVVLGSLHRVVLGSSPGARLHVGLSSEGSLSLTHHAENNQVLTWTLNVIETDMVFY